MPALLMPLLTVLTTAANPVVALTWRAPAAPSPVVGRVDALVREGLAALDAVTVLAEPDTRVGRQLAVDAGWRCGGGPDCLAALGRVLGVQVMVEGTVEPQDGAYVLRLVTVDVESALSTGTAYGRLANNGAGWKQAAARTVHAAFSRGTVLQLHGGAPGDWLEMDEERVPLTPPLTSLPGLVPGPHKVRWSIPGQPPVDLDVPEKSPLLHMVVPVSAFAAPQPVKRTTPSPWPLLGSAALLTLGLSTVLWAVPVALGGVLGGAGSAELLLSLQREPGGRIQAARGQSRAEVEARRNQGLWLGGGAVAFLAGALLMGGVGVVASAAGIVASVVSWNRQGDAS